MSDASNVRQCALCPPVVHCLAACADLKRDDPILYVRNRLIAERKLLPINEKAELLFRARNAHRLEETRTLMRLSGGPLPMLEG